MGTGWRRAFCTTAQRDSIDTDPRQTHSNHQEHSSSPSPGTCVKLGFFSSISNPSTPPRLPASSPSPSLSCRTTTTTTAAVTGQPPFSANSSPRSPFSILKNTLRLSRGGGCGVCLRSVRTGQGTAIYTAECSHAFHFPCIAAHVRKQGSLTCPVCNVTWKDVPLLSIHRNLSALSPAKGNEVVEHVNTANGAKTMRCDDKLIQSSVSVIKTKGSMQPKLYNDDEPLLSPAAAGARFNTIPEEAEEQSDVEDGTSEDDVGEFQGFFVNPTPSTSEKIGNGHDWRTPRNVEVKLLHEAAVVMSMDRTHETFVVALRVKAPSNLPPTADGVTTTTSIVSQLARAPIDLVTVLDISGSMAGPKLQMLKSAMRLIISSLSQADRLSIVAFSSASRRILPLKRMTDHGQRSARRVVDRLVCGQGKCAAEGLRKASKVLGDRREKNPVASIILLSDTADEKVPSGSRGFGYQPRSHCHDTSIRFAHIEIPVRSYKPAEHEFMRYIGGILSVVVQDLRVQLGFSTGSASAEIMTVYTRKGLPALLTCDSARLGDLYAEEERELLIEIKVPASEISSRRVMTVRCSYRDPTTQELMFCRERSLLVPRPHTIRSADPRIERLRRSYITTRALAESRCLIEHRDFANAKHLLASARGFLSRSDLPAGDEFTRRLEAAQTELQWQQEHHEKEEVTQVQARREEVANAGEKEDPLTPTSAWRAAEKLAKLAVMKKSLNKVSDLHGFENAGF